MTIAVCYVSPEGIVLGADSTSTYLQPDGSHHYFNHAQKIFEIGRDSNLALVTWGLGGIGNKSHRMLAATLHDSLNAAPAASLQQVAERWVDIFWPVYSADQGFLRCATLSQMLPYVPAGGANVRSESEEKEFNGLRQFLVVGFCVGGYVLPDRQPGAYITLFDPLSPRPAPSAIVPNGIGAWGAPNMMERLFNGSDAGLRHELMSCGKWSGTAQELNQIFSKYALTHPILPVRDAIDFVYSSVHSTVKAFKFSSLSQICGGPIEIAVITADRPFRWVRHKQWDSAITDGDP